MQLAFVFGSFARNDERADSDIDVLVLGTISALKTNSLLRPLSRKYGRPFKASVFTLEAFKKLLMENDPFASEVVQEPKIPLIGDSRVIASMYAA